MRLVVIGGVAGGMSAAARARRLDEDAEIVVLEQGPYVSYANCGLPYYVGGEITDEAALLVQTPDSLRESLNLDVRVNSQVTAIEDEHVTVVGPEGEYQLAYDAIVLSPGAVAAKPPLPGLDLPHVTTLRTVDDALALRQRVETPGRAVVLGAGFIGVETAEALAAQDWDVQLVELAPHVLPPLETEIAVPVQRELRRLGIGVHVGVAAEAITPEHVRLSDGTELPADLVVLSIGVRADTSLTGDIRTENGAIVVDEHGQTSNPKVWAVGDATLSVDAVTGALRPVALAGPANRAGRLVADHIFNPETARPIPAALGTAIVRVGDLTAALTGANRRALEGINYRTIHLHPNQHAGYFPGATSLSLLVHFAEEDGRILGAQAVGKEGVDKRIDVIATAMRAGLTIEDLIDLDLAYSPPYGMAKDPVNLAGMIGSNVRSGELQLWYVDDIPWAQENATIVDVRSAAEFATGHIPGAINIPHTEIREHLDELRGRPVRLICKSGMRSYLAYRVLVQEGFEDVASFSGGSLTWKDSADA